MINVIKKTYPLIDENNQPSTYPTFSSQVILSSGKALEENGIFTANPALNANQAQNSELFEGKTFLQVLSLIYPIGSIYMSLNRINPSVLFGGVWEQLTDRFLIGENDTYTLGTTGGATTHYHSTNAFTLTTSHLPSHKHNVRVCNDGCPDGWGDRSTSSNRQYWHTGSNVTNARYNTNPQTEATGGGQSHTHGNTAVAENIPPYLAVYMWKRVG